MDRPIEVFRNENQRLAARKAALELLVESRDSRAIEAVSEIIRSNGKHTALRMETIRAVGHRRVDAVEVLDALVHALADNSRRIKRSAAAALGYIGDASSIEALRTLLSQKVIDAETRALVVSVLGKFGISRAHSERVMSILINVLETKGDDRRVRASAAWSLSRFRHVQSVGTLEAIAESEDEPRMVRAECIRALAHLASEKMPASAGTDGLLRPSGSYILDPSMHGPDWAEVQERFRRYKHYLESIGERLPPGAREYALGSRHNCLSRECPHDSCLEELRMEVRSTGDRSQCQELDLHTRFLGSDLDGHIEFHYRNVRDYWLAADGGWMYDDVRLGEEGAVIHEIRFSIDSHWLIECEDSTYEWTPFDLSP